MKHKILSIVTVLSIMYSCKNESKTTESYDTDTDQEQVIETPKSQVPDTPTTTAVATSDLEQDVQNFITCKKAETERNDCRNSITKIISKRFDLMEFNDPKLGYVVFDSIRPIAERSKHWIQLGTITQETIDQALAHTNRGGLSLIIDTANPYGHVVMIVPGESKKSGSWGMKLPNVLSLANHKPEKSFSDKPLSYAMTQSEDVKIYLRQ